MDDKTQAVIDELEKVRLWAEKAIVEIDNTKYSDDVISYNSGARVVYLRVYMNTIGRIEALKKEQGK